MLFKRPNHLNWDFAGGKKPAIPVVAWSHPLARGLTSFNLMRDDIDDLAADGSLIRADSTYTYHHIFNQQQCLHIDATASLSRVDFSGRVIPDSSAHTILCCVSQIVVGSTGTSGFYTENAGTANHILRMLSATSFEFLINSLTNDRVSHTFAPANDVPFICGGAWGGSGTALKVITVDDTNGLKITANGATSTGTYSAANPAFSNPNGGGRTHDYYWFAAWDRELSETELQAFTSNPYQILKPAANAPIYLASAGVAGTTHNVSVSESITLSESQSNVLAANVSQAESVTLSDACSATVIFAAAQAEALALSESQSASQVAQVSQSESVTLGESSDASIGATTHNVSITESASLTESQSANAVLNASISESISLSELSDGATGIFGYLSESLSLADSQSASTVVLAATVESVSLGESSTTILISNADITELMSLVDQASGTVHFEAATEETISLSDIQAAALAQIHSVSITESINLTDLTFITNTDFVAGNISVWRLAKRGSTWLLSSRGSVWKLRG